MFAPKVLAAKDLSMKYQILDADDIGGLTSKVERLIELGWAPLGGVSSYVQWENVHFIQAMIKNAD
jgi:Domain of unknown function (DUF1737)